MSPGEMLTVSDVDRWGIKKMTKKNRNKEIRVKASLLVFTTREYFPREIIFKLYYAKRMGFSGGSAVKNLPVVQEMQEMWSWSLNREDLLEEGMATHSSTLVWRIPMDRWAWWATVHRVAKSWTRLKRLSTYIYKIRMFVYLFPIATVTNYHKFSDLK